MEINKNKKLVSLSAYDSGGLNSTRGHKRKKLFISKFSHRIIIKSSLLYCFVYHYYYLLIWRFRYDRNFLFACGIIIVYEHYS